MGDNEILTSIDAFQANEAKVKERALRMNWDANAETNPDDFARKVALSKATRIPIQSLYADPVETQRIEAQRSQDFVGLIKDAPHTANFFLDSTNVGMAKDDAGTLSALEKTLSVTGGVLGNVAMGATVGVGASLFDVAAIPFDIASAATKWALPKEWDVLGQMAAGSRKHATDAREAMDYFTPKAAGNVEAGVYSGARSAGTMLAVLPASVEMAVVKGTAFAAELIAGAFGVTTGAEAYTEARNKGKDAVGAATYAIPQGVFEYAFEKSPASVVANALTHATGLKAFAWNLLKKEIPSEQLTTLTQDFNTWMNLNPEKTLKQFAQERPGAAAQTLVATIVGAGIQTGAIHGVQKATGLADQQSANAQTTSDNLRELFKHAAESLTNKRSPETFAQFVQSVADAHNGDQPANVYIDAGVLNQVMTEAGLDTMTLLPSVAEQMQEAGYLNTPMEIPVGEFMSALAGKGLDEKLVDHLRTDPNAPSLAETKEFGQKANAFFEAESTRIMEDNSKNETFKAGAQEVQDHVEGIIRAQNTKLGPDAIKTNASLVKNFYVVAAGELGITPSQLMNGWTGADGTVHAGYRLSAPGASAVGGELNQGVHPFANFTREQFIGNPKITSDANAKDLKPNDFPGLKGADSVPFLKSEFTAKFGDGIAAVYEGGKVIASYQGNTLVVDKKYRRQGIGEELVYQYRMRNSAEAPAKERTAKSQALQEKVWARIEKERANILHQSAKVASVPIPVEVAQAASIDNAYQIANGEQFEYIRDLKIKIQEEVLKAANGVDLSAMTSDIMQHLVSMGVTEGLQALKSNANAAGWYDIKTRQALSIVALVHPEILTDENARFAFIYALAVTSNGQKVNKNFELAERAYQGWKATGKMPDDVGAGGPARKKVHEALAKFNTLIEQFGTPSAVAEFMLTEFTVKELADAGFNVSGELKTETVLGAAILGPKIGNGFFANLYGEFNQLTMDRWLMRTWGRWTGTLISDNAQAIKDEAKVLAAIVKGVKADKTALNAARTAFATTTGGNIDKSKMKVFDDLVKLKDWEHLAEQIKLKSTYPAVRKVLLSTPLTDELRRSGNRLAGKLDGQNEAPTGGGQRKWIRDAFTQILNSVNGEVGVKLTMADLQALLWYPEKRLYDSAKSDESLEGYDDDDAPDYANAAAGLARSRGVSDDAISAAIARPADRSTTIRVGKRNDTGAVLGGGQQTQENNGSAQDAVLNQSSPDGIGQPGALEQESRGTFSPTTLTLTLTENADLSTFAHEAGHFFLTMYADLAAMPDAPAKIKSDMDTILKWFGVADLATWHGMTLEQQRPHHEQLAESLEQYLFTGEAPSIELKSMYRKIADWMKRVYKDAQAFVATHTGAKLNPEISAVFDRMLASDAAIDEANAARNLNKLFKTAAEGGMTDQQFAAYIGQDAQQSADAKEDLRVRSLRDMKWLENRTNKVLKELQKDAKEKRKDMRNEVAREVWSRPVYQAWQFLTAKENLEKVKPAPKPANFKGVDETRDTLIEAIAKLGGLDRESAQEQLGVHPDNFGHKSGIFGKPAFRKEKGNSVEHMVEKLLDYGYLDADNQDRSAMSDLEEKLAAELSGSPIYSSNADYDFLQNGPNRVTPENMALRPGGRLDTALVRSYGTIISDKLEALRMTRTDALHPDDVAAVIGFESGDEMLKALAEAQKPRDEIEAITDQRMLEKYGDITSPEALRLAANEAIHNDAHLKFLATELAALNKNIGSPALLMKVVKDAARALVGSKVMFGSKTAKAFKPWVYQAAEVRAGKAAEVAMTKGKREEAAQQKRAQMLNHAAVKESHDALREINKALAKLKLMTTLPESKLESRDMAIVSVVRAVLAEHGIGNKGEKAQTYLDTMGQYEPALRIAMQKLIDDANTTGKPYTDMTVDEFHDFADNVKGLWQLAKQEKQIEIDGKVMLLKDAQNQVYEQLEKYGIPDQLPGEYQAVTKAEEKVRFWQQGVKFIRRVESWLGTMDQGQQQGPMKRFLFSQIRDAVNEKNLAQTAFIKEYLELLKSIEPTLTRRKVYASELYDARKPALVGPNGPVRQGYTFGAEKDGIAMLEIQAALLHTGNESNLEKLLLGRGWADQRMDGTLDTTRWQAFQQRMIDDGIITKANFDFAQGVWNLTEKTKPMAQKAHRALFGKYFHEVTANEFTNQFGTYVGGYVPAIMDSSLNPDANVREIEAQEREELAFAFPAAPGKGFTMSRTGITKPLKLDLRLIPQHIGKVMNFAHLSVPIKHVQAILKDPRINNALHRIDPAAMPDMILPWLARVASQTTSAPIQGAGKWMHIFDKLRTRTGAQQMMGNISNTVQQVTGFSTAANIVSAGEMAHTTGLYLRSPSEFVKTVAELSPYMATRIEGEIHALNGSINAILLNPTAIEKAEAFTMRHAYFLQSAVDSAMSPIIWMAAYNQAKANAPTTVPNSELHLFARRVADEAIRSTQGSNDATDVSRLEASNAFVKMFTQYFSWFNTQGNFLLSQWQQAGQKGGFEEFKTKARLTTLAYIVPSIVAELIAVAFKGGPDDDDKNGTTLDNWAMAMAMAPLKFAMAMVPVLGQAMTLVINKMNDKIYDDRYSSPIIGFLESAANVPGDVLKIIKGKEGKPSAIVHDVLAAVTLATGIVLGVVERPVKYLADVAAGKVNPTGPVDMTRGIITGTASPASKSR